jgi:hypothetical protein
MRPKDLYVEEMLAGDQGACGQWLPDEPPECSDCGEPAGFQCRACGLWFCQDCFGHDRAEAHSTEHPQPCPDCAVKAYQQYGVH